MGVEARRVVVPSNRDSSECTNAKVLLAASIFNDRTSEGKVF